MTCGTSWRTANSFARGVARYYVLWLVRTAVHRYADSSVEGTRSERIAHMGERVLTSVER